MRLTDQEVQAIKAAAREAFGETVVVRLFGSRVYDHLKGGDIDLLLEVESGHADIRHEARFLDTLFNRIDEQRVDLTFMIRGTPPSAFASLVARDAVVLT